MKRRRSLLAPFADAADEQALLGIRKRYGDVRLEPVAFVVPAYNEADTIEKVLAQIPSHCRLHDGVSLAIDVVVVIDGATDRTTEAVARQAERQAGAGPRIFICDIPNNRGQGAALRLGYAIARNGGAQFIVTFDADGQYDIQELPLLLEPLHDGTADFVTGSRTLGTDQAADLIRSLGTRFFATMVSFLTGKKVTDTSFGFRAMRSEVSAAILLEQPQYQSSELLIGVIQRGFRVEERGMTIRRRVSGRSKKGSNLVFGCCYARVVLRTWLRERRASTRREKCR